MISNPMSRVLYIILPLLFLSACLSHKAGHERSLAGNQPSVLDNPESITPPNAIRINDSLFVDWTENSNLNWKEYTYDVGRHFGIQSKEYQESLPRDVGNVKRFNVDSLLTQDSGVSRARYFLMPEYDEYPVTGITLEQAKKYSKWRSDRVFYIYLIESGILDFNPEHHFTIEEFLLSDEYQNNADKITHYPEYFIPSLEHFELVKEKVQLGRFLLGDLHTLDEAFQKQLDTYLPLTKVGACDGVKCPATLYNFAGNVSELVDSENVVFGGNYLHTKSEVKDLPIHKVNLPNEMVGFRNFCRWVAIENPLAEEEEEEIEMPVLLSPFYETVEKE